MLVYLVHATVTCSRWLVSRGMCMLKSDLAFAKSNYYISTEFSTKHFIVKAQ